MRHFPRFVEKIQLNGQLEALVMFLLPFQLIIAMCAFLAGIPISRKLFPDKDEGFWQIIGLSLSSIYFATVTVIGILLNNFGINSIVICATMIWIIFGIITVRDYKSSSSLKTVSTFYISLFLMAIVYQLIIFWKFHFPQSGAIGYPIDNFFYICCIGDLPLILVTGVRWEETMHTSLAQSSLVLSPL